MKVHVFPLALSLLLACHSTANANSVLEDGGISMTRADLEQAVKRWSPNMQQSAAEDERARYELLSLTLASKKIAAEADKWTEEENPELYWKKEYQVREVKRRAFVDGFLASIEIPDMRPLAEESYRANRDKYGLVGEQRMSSHILILCMTTGECDHDEVNRKVDAIAAALVQGTAFEELAEEYSDDPGSKGQGGKFDRWIGRDSREVVPEYVDALFKLEEVGSHTGPIGSQFGVHIIRLDAIEDAYYRPFEEVEEEVIASLMADYRKLAGIEFDKKYRLSPEAKIDAAVIDEILEPYKLDVVELSDEQDSEGSDTGEVQP